MTIFPPLIHIGTGNKIVFIFLIYVVVKNQGFKVIMGDVGNFVNVILKDCLAVLEVI